MEQRATAYRLECFYRWLLTRSLGSIRNFSELFCAVGYGERALKTEHRPRELKRDEVNVSIRTVSYSKMRLPLEVKIRRLVGRIKIYARIVRKLHNLKGN